MGGRMGGKKAGLGRRDYEALAAFRHALRQFLRFSEEAAREAGITPAQHQALLAVHGYPGGAPVAVGELAERLQVKHHSAVGLVDRLCALGLMSRVASARDRRRVLVRLTAKGVRKLEALSASHRDELLRLGPRLASIAAALGGAEGGPAPSRGSERAAGGARGAR